MENIISEQLKQYLDINIFYVILTHTDEIYLKVNFNNNERKTTIQILN